MEEIKPREKALNYGLNSLSNVELLCLILKTAYKNKHVDELAKEIIEKAGGFKNLFSLSYPELINIKGIKNAKALELMAILEIAKRLSKIDYVSDKNVVEIEKIVEFIRFQIAYSNQEEFLVIYLSNNGRILKTETLFKGTNNKSLIGVEEIFRNAILYKANAIIVAHNHPSNNPCPSKADIEVTRNISEISRLFNINFIDHIIVSKSSYFSFKSQQMM